MVRDSFLPQIRTERSCGGKYFSRAFCIDGWFLHALMCEISQHLHRSKGSINNEARSKATHSMVVLSMWAGTPEIESSIVGRNLGSFDPLARESSRRGRCSFRLNSSRFDIALYRLGSGTGVSYTLIMI